MIFFIKMIKKENLNNFNHRDLLLKRQNLGKFKAKDLTENLWT